MLLLESKGNTMYYPIKSGQIFPTVNGYGTFMSLVGEKDEIKTGVAKGFQTVSYVVSMPTTFDNPYARECRGIVFNVDGLVVGRPLHKFFNLNERDGARPEDFDWTTLTRVMDKRDGSMIHTVNVGLEHSPFQAAGSMDSGWSWRAGEGCSFDLKSKKSFTSDVANQARVLMQKMPNYVAFCQEMTTLDYTAIFEYTSPTARIVLAYQKEELTLLHIRDNLTGRYLSPGELDAHAARYNIKLVDHPDGEVAVVLSEMLVGTRDSKTIWHAVQKLMASVEGIEGWIFQFANGEMVKVKTRWYMDRHGIMTNNRERDMHEAVLNETIDDKKAMLRGEGVDVTELEQIEAHVGGILTGILHEINEVLKVDGKMERKDFALKYGGAGMKHQYFGLIMKAYEGKEPDVRGYYTRNILPTVSLRQLNLLQSTAEAE
jgi:RNA ligase